MFAELGGWRGFVFRGKVDSTTTCSSDCGDQNLDAKIGWHHEDSIKLGS